MYISRAPFRSPESLGNTTKEAHEFVVGAAVAMFKIATLTSDEVNLKFHLISKTGEHWLISDICNEQDKQEVADLIHMLEPTLEQVHIVMEGWALKSNLSFEEAERIRAGVSPPPAEHPNRTEVYQVLTFTREGCASTMWDILGKGKSRKLGEPTSDTPEVSKDSRFSFFHPSNRPN
jgi:hypothetical protein